MQMGVSSLLHMLLLMPKMTIIGYGSFSCFQLSFSVMHFNPSSIKLLSCSLIVKKGSSKELNASFLCVHTAIVFVIWSKIFIKNSKTQNLKSSFGKQHEQ